jgi:putative transcriptional regulator
MKPDTFKLLLQSATEMRAIRRGARKPARSRLVTAESAQVVRTRLGLSQPAFADLLGISVATLRNWEQGRRQPTGAAEILLRIAAKHPTIVREAVSA